MDVISWSCLIVGLLFIIGAWTNLLNFDVDDNDDDGAWPFYGGWLIFTFICAKNRKAYRVFLWIFGLTLIFLAIYSSPFVEGRLQSTPLN